MIKFQEKKELDFTSKQIFDLVMDIEKYPQFLPWISGASIIKEYTDHIIAELDIYFKGYKTSYLSEVSTKIDDGTYEISIESKNGPFKSLKNFYVIRSIGEKKCSMFFDNSIELRFKLLETIIEPVLSKYVEKIILAFEERAGDIYSLKT
jgi:coenzyme Q-binding protein COQ10